MTVKELIEQLEKLPMDLPIGLWDSNREKMKHVSNVRKTDYSDTELVYIDYDEYAEF